MIKYLILTCIVVLFSGASEASILVVSPNGTYAAKSNLLRAATDSDTAGKTIVITSALSAVQSNISTSTLHAWPSDRFLKVEKGGSIGNTTRYNIAGPFEAGLYQVFTGSGKVTFGAGSVKEVYPEWWGVFGEKNTPVESTARLQAAINAAVGNRLVINPGKYGISFVGWGKYGLALDIPSNIVIEFMPGASLEALPHNVGIYQMMRIWDRDNVTIINGYVNGRKDLNSHVDIGASTENSGMGFDVRGGTNIKLINPTTLNCWGDGIYWAKGIVTGNSKKGYVLNHHADGCRRQGMSIISADDLVVETPVWENTGGTAPGAGLDIEPDNNSEDLKNIRIYKPTTRNNTIGIQIYLGSVQGANNKSIHIEITGHRDDGSTIGFIVNGANTKSGTYVVNGSITSTDPVYSNNLQCAFLSSEYDYLGPTVQLIRPIVVNSNRSAQPAPEYGSPFIVLRDTGSTLKYPIGNVHIIEPSINLTSGSIPALFSFIDKVNGWNNLKNCSFLDPIKLDGVTKHGGVFRGMGNISNKFGVWNRTAVTSETLTDFSIAPVATSNKSVTFTLSNTLFHFGSPDIEITAKYATSCIVQTESGGNFVGMTAGQRLQSISAPGSYLRIRPLGSGVFSIIDKVGVWNIVQ